GARRSRAVGRAPRSPTGRGTRGSHRAWPPARPRSSPSDSVPEGLRRAGHFMPTVIHKVTRLKRDSASHAFEESSDETRGHCFVVAGDEFRLVTLDDILVALPPRWRRRKPRS